MQKSKLGLGIGILILLLAGFGIITYKGMPVRQLEAQLTQQPQSASENTQGSPLENTGGTSTGALTYSMQEVQSHSSQGDCWAAVNGEVYDLSSQVSRHPGGAGAILSMCGSDSSAAFNRQHGRSGRAQSALALLKIGSLI